MEQVAGVGAERAGGTSDWGRRERVPNSGGENVSMPATGGEGRRDVTEAAGQGVEPGQWRHGPAFAFGVSASLSLVLDASTCSWTWLFPCLAAPINQSINH